MSSVRVTKQITAWLKRQVFVKRKEGDCTRFVLHHIGTSGKLGPEITTINVGENKAPGESISEDDLQSYAMELETDASNYAEGIGATQTFAIAAYFDDDPARALARYTFRINIESAEDNDDVASEPGNAAGMAKQQMRHNEMLMKINTGAFGSILGTLQRQNEQLGAMVEKLFNDRIEQIEAVETLMSAKHERDMEVEQAKISGAQKAQVLDNVIALLPAIANKFVGKKILPETADVIQMQMVRLMEALTPLEVQRILDSIDSPEKKVAMIELLKLVQEKVGAVGDAETTNSAS